MTVKIKVSLAKLAQVIIGHKKSSDYYDGTASKALILKPQQFCLTPQYVCWYHCLLMRFLQNTIRRPESNITA